MQTSNTQQYNAATVKHGSNKIAVLLANVNYSNTSFAQAADFYEQELKAAVGKGALVKVVANWKQREVHAERFWVQVTKTVANKAGVKQHWGKICNDTQVASCGDVIGPINECNIAQVDCDFVEQLKYAA
jgi:aspartyl aminopeptidase